MDWHVKRRAFLLGLSGNLAIVAGCISGDEDSDIKDSDGDGVIDSADYAPQDPEVQEKSDLQKTAKSAGPVATASPTPTPTATPTPSPSATPFPSPDDSDNVLHVSDNLGDQSHITSYSASTVNLEVHSYPEIPIARAKALAITYTYPRDEAVGYGTSDPFTVPSGQNTVPVTVPIGEGEIPRSERLHHMVFAMPADQSVEEVSTDDLTYLYETDPFTVNSADKISRDPPDHEKSHASTESFERRIVEGAYSLSFNGQTQGKSWFVDLYIWKSAYSQAFNEPRGRSYGEYVSVAQTSGEANTIAEILNDAAEANGFTGKREKVELVIDWVQSLPYVTDDVSRGYDNYAKFLTETVVDVSGDCEDTSILLAAVLQAEPFSYDMVLIQPPEHMAAGIYGEDLPGYYWEYDGRKYYYIETTGEGWGIGDLPEIYQGEDAIVHQV